VNKIIPIAKHYEALTQEFNALHPYIINYKSEESNKWYNEILTPTLTKMVSEGFKINSNFKKYFDINEKFSIKEDKIYGWYNFCTTTGRPTNNFNKINLSALKHDSGERDSFEADNDILIEMDYEGYHPRIIAYLVGYHINDKESVHTQLAKMYFETEEIDSEMYKKSKELTFQQMYGGISKKYLKHEYFNKTQKFIDTLWDEFNEKGYVKTLIARRRLLKDNYKNITPQKLFNYYIQAFETEYNITLLSRIFKFLEDKKTKMVLYVYDSMLFDFSLEDGKETLQSLTKLISSDFPIKLKRGNIYSSLKAL
jgi:DNA polymerase-1